MAFCCRAGGGLLSLLCTELSGAVRRAATMEIETLKSCLPFLPKDGQLVADGSVGLPMFWIERISLTLAFATFTRKKKKCFTREMQNTYGMIPPVDLTVS